MTDLVDRQAAIEAIAEFLSKSTSLSSCFAMAHFILAKVPSAHPELLTDKEQRIFLAAMGREEKVCKETDEEC